MVNILNPNTTEVTKDNTLLYLQEIQEGLAKKSSTGTTSSISWFAGQVKIDRVDFFPLVTEPVVIDFAFDSLDRGQVVYKLPDNTTY